MVQAVRRRRSVLRPTLIGIAIVLGILLFVMLVWTFPASVETGGGVTPVASPTRP
jgi:UDP-N-acetylmuramyl pentapeptide phosphotransferase/UDP-N-acetylglucosamine-1-phosphate transferase